MEFLFLPRSLRDYPIRVGCAKLKTNFAHPTLKVLNSAKKTATTWFHYLTARATTTY